MENLKILYQKITHSPKLIVLSLLTVFSLILILLTATNFGQPRPKKVSVLPEATPSAKPTPLIGALIQEEPYSTPTLTINWTNQEIDIPPKMKIFSISEPLLKPRNVNSISQKLGFSESTEQESIDINFRAWQKEDSSLTINFLDNELSFTASETPIQKPNITYAEDSYVLAANNYLQNIFGSNFVKTLIKKSVVYSQLHDFQSTVSSEKDATTILVTYYQSVDGYPITTSSEIGSIVAVVLDKNLSLNSLIIKSAYTGLTSLGEFNTIPLSELVKNSNSTALRINASSGYDVGVEASVRNIRFNQQTVKVAYYSKNKQFIPVYLLEGTVKTSVTSEQPGLYILPATQ